jgi:hypothetical protein
MLMRAVPALRRRARYKKKSKHRSKDKRIPLLTVLPIASKAVVEPFFGNGSDLSGAKQQIDAGNFAGAAIEFLDVMSINFTGFKMSDGSNWWVNHGTPKPITTYATIGLGILGSKLANKFGVNRQIRKIPVVGKYIKL